MGWRQALRLVRRCCSLLLLVGATAGGGWSAFGVSTGVPAVAAAPWPSGVLEMLPVREYLQRRISLWDDFAAFLVTDARQHWRQQWMNVARGLARADATLRTELDPIQSAWPIARSATRVAPLHGPWWMVPVSEVAVPEGTGGSQGIPGGGGPSSDAVAGVQGAPIPAIPVAVIQGLAPLASSGREEGPSEGGSPLAATPSTDGQPSSPQPSSADAPGPVADGEDVPGAMQRGRARTGATENGGETEAATGDRDSRAEPEDGGTGTRADEETAPGRDGEGGQSRQNPSQRGEWQTVVASWYGPGFYGRPTASGEIFTGREMTAAHRTMPFGTLLLVRYPATGRTVQVRINDRGPFVRGRDLDLSEAAAESLGMIAAGVARVQTRVLRWGGEGDR